MPCRKPLLLGSRTPADVVTGELQRRASGKWRSGDRFFLATDALAQWFLKQIEDQGRPWETLAAVCEGDEEGFAAWIDTLRDEKEIRNDDVTLLVIDV